jgi:hypothetical protein
MFWWWREPPFWGLLSTAREQRAAGDTARGVSCLPAKAVQGAALALEGVDHVHGGHGLAARVLGVGDGVTHNVLWRLLDWLVGVLFGMSVGAAD